MIDFRRWGDQSTAEVLNLTQRIGAQLLQPQSLPGSVIPPAASRSPFLLPLAGMLRTPSARSYVWTAAGIGAGTWRRVGQLTDPLARFGEYSSLTTSPDCAMLQKSMGYPGGKNGAGVYQRIINLMPPHDVYIEPFLGGGAVMRLKKPARLNIGLDLADSAVSAMLATIASFGEFSSSSSGSGIVRSREGRSPIVGTGDIRRRSSLDLTIPAGIVGNGDPAGGNVRNGDTVLHAGNGDTVLHAGNGDTVLHAGNGDTVLHAGNGDTVLHAGNGDAADFRFLRGDGIRFLTRYPFTGNEVVYCDPPYVRSTRSGRDLYRFEMSDVDHRRLLRAIRKIPARVLISGYWSEMYARELRRWNRITFESMTRGGYTATEWLWYNFDTPAALHDYRYLGQNFRERERINRKKRRWTERLKRMPLLERQALLCAIASIDG